MFNHHGICNWFSYFKCFDRHKVLFNDQMEVTVTTIFSSFNTANFSNTRSPNLNYWNQECIICAYQVSEEVALFSGAKSHLICEPFNYKRVDLKLGIFIIKPTLWIPNYWIRFRVSWWIRIGSRSMFWWPKVKYIATGILYIWREIRSKLLLRPPERTLKAQDNLQPPWKNLQLFEHEVFHLLYLRWPFLTRSGPVLVSCSADTIEYGSSLGPLTPKIKRWGSGWQVSLCKALSQSEPGQVIIKPNSGPCPIKQTIKHNSYSLLTSQAQD